MRYNKHMPSSRHGMTLIEILIAITLVVLTAGIGLLALNPVGQLAAARNSERKLQLQGIIQAVRQNITDTTTGVFSCPSAGALPTSTPKIMGSASGNYNIAPCLTILQTMPFDPLASSSYYNSNVDYNTGYTIVYNTSTTQITVAAPYAELGKSVSITR